MLTVIGALGRTPFVEDGEPQANINEQITASKQHLTDLSSFAVRIALRRRLYEICTARSFMLGFLGGYFGLRVTRFRRFR